jgi:hypothetical protein
MTLGKLAIDDVIFVDPKMIVIFLTVVPVHSKLHYMPSGFHGVRRIAES